MVVPPPEGTPVDAAVPGIDTRPPGDTGTTDAPPDAPATGADLSIAVHASPAPVDLSSTLTYTIDVENHGALEASDVVVTQRLPAGNVAFQSATGIDWTCTHDGQDVTCKRPTLHVGAAPSIAVKVTTPPTSGSLSSSVHVTASTPDPVPTNNDDLAATMVLAPDLATADLAIALADSPDPVQGTTNAGCPGASCTLYTIDVTNAGPDVATEVQVAITLPGQGTFFNVVGEGWVCPAPQGGKVICARPSVAADGVKTTILLTWKAPSPGGFSIQTSTTVSASSTDPNATNDTAIEATTVKP
jgi:uncharacterized repeat protein (TIGR01451 family)